MSSGVAARRDGSQSVATAVDVSSRTTPAVVATTAGGFSGGRVVALPMLRCGRCGDEFAGLSANCPACARIVGIIEACTAAQRRRRA